MPTRRLVPFLAALVALVSPPASAAGTAMPGVERGWHLTAPVQPVAGTPTTFAFASFGNLIDLDPSTLPVATVAGDTIRIETRDECRLISCDTVGVSAFKVELPALAAGRYRVEVYLDPPGAMPNERFTLDVAAAPAIAPIAARPADGFWSDPRRPGTGLFLQHRGSDTAVGVFDHVAGQTLWSVDASPRHGDAVIVTPPVFAEGACFGCTAGGEPRSYLSFHPLRIRFESARRAFVDHADGTTTTLVSLPFGVDYVAVALADPGDATFGALALPDLQGRWLLDAPLALREVAIGPPRPNGGDVDFDLIDAVVPPPALLQCRSVNGELGAGCWILSSCCSPPAQFAFARLADITEDRIRFVAYDAQLQPTQTFEALRLPQRD